MVLRTSLKVKLVIFSLVIGTLPILFAYFLVQQNIAMARDELRADSMTAAKLSRAIVDDTVADTKALLSTMSRFPVITGSNPPAIQLFLQETLALHPDLLVLFVTDGEGSVVALADTFDSHSRANLDAPRLGARNDGLSQSLTFGRTSSGMPVSYLRVPLSESLFGPASSIGAGVSLQALQSKLDLIVAKRQGTVVLADSQGNVLTQSDGDSTLARPNLARLLEVVTGAQGDRTWEDFTFSDGKPWLRTAGIIERTGWYFVVSLPAGVGYPTLLSIVLQQLLPLLFVGLVAIYGALAIAEKLTRPLHKLAVAASSVAKGQLGREVEIGTGDEIEEMAGVFNYMSRSLAAHVSELTEAKAELTRKAAQLSELLARTFRSQEEERNRIAIDLHDGVAQLLVGALYEVQVARRSIATAPDITLHKLHQVEGLLNSAAHEMRAVIFDLHPSHLYHHGLPVAIERYVDQFSQATDIICAARVYGESVRLPVEVETAVYRIVQEALHNIRRHSGANAAYVVLVFHQAGVKLTVQDNGRGFDKDSAVASSDGHLGLVGMQERAGSIGATLEIVAVPGKGTRITLDVPITERPERSGSEGKAKSTGESNLVAVCERAAGVPDVHKATGGHCKWKR
ncbi:MAG: HAMP domain-containing protein [Chloroflexi bacterium]|nr:HAMP domain-containing protein [Chloroflexota bacterium]